MAKWVTDVIGEEYKEWENELVVLGMGMGRGKTTFALDVYSVYLKNRGKSVLYLCNRSTLKKQVRARIGEDYESGENREITKLTANVQIMTYQYLQELISNGQGDFDDFDVYICDEAHYFLADAEFNYYTDVVYNFLRKQLNHSVVIFMTATYRNIYNFVKKTTGEAPRLYELETDYDYVKKIVWYKQRELYGIIDTILRTTNDKIIYFCNSLTKMETLYKHYCPSGNEQELDASNIKYFDFYCSQYSKSPCALAHCKQEVLVLQDDFSYKFNNRVLMATKAIDNGIDIKDSEVKHVICDIADIESAVQCLGRRRFLGEDDSCTFYIKNYQRYDWNIYSKNVKMQLEQAELFKKDSREWKRRFAWMRDNRDPSIYITADKRYRLNRLRYEKFKTQESLINKMKTGEITYKDEILSYLGNVATERSVDSDKGFKEDGVQDVVKMFIDTHMEQYLLKAEQQDLIKRCGLKDGKQRPRGSVSMINQYLREEYNCKVESKVVRLPAEDGSGKTKPTRVWIIEELPEQDGQEI